MLSTCSARRLRFNRNTAVDGRVAMREAEGDNIDEIVAQNAVYCAANPLLISRSAHAGACQENCARI